MEAAGEFERELSELLRREQLDQLVVGQKSIPSQALGVEVEGWG